LVTLMVEGADCPGFRRCAAGVYRLGAASSRGAEHALKRALRSHTMPEVQSGKLPPRQRRLGDPLQQ
ncbi:MAG: hypothetical protein ABFE13_13990, partial [Phycisphaerales bacterium]